MMVPYTAPNFDEVLELRAGARLREPWKITHMTAKHPRSYGELLRRVMSSGGLCIRDVAVRTGYSYEHIRKIANGTGLPSPELNDQMAEELGFDGASAWRMVVTETLRRKMRSLSFSIAPPDDPEIQAVWSELTRDQQLQIAEIARAMASMRE
jgi:transcriptional regulator with XRE-family HTH domain